MLFYKTNHKTERGFLPDLKNPVTKEKDICKFENNSQKTIQTPRNIEISPHPIFVIRGKGRGDYPKTLPTEQKEKKEQTEQRSWKWLMMSTNEKSINEKRIQVKKLYNQ